MTCCQCRLYRKTESGTDPEPYEEVDGRTRRIVITPLMSARKAIEEGARLNVNVTHMGRADWDDELQSKRLLKRLDDDRYFLIEAVMPTGRPRRGATHAPRARLSLSVHNVEANL